MKLRKFVSRKYLHGKKAAYVRAAFVRTACLASIVLTSISILNAAETQPLDVEKDEIKFGFIKLTDMAPLAVAYEKGYFEDEGLFVTLEPQANWKVCLLYTSPSPRDATLSRMPSSA